MNTKLESLPGAVSIFARAYQRQTGGTQTGSEAIKTLLAAMKKGQVKGDILTYAGDIAAETAGPGVDRASQTSQGQQARFENSLNDTAIIASAAGVEEGFARLFKTLSEGLDGSQGAIEDLAAGFNKATQAASFLLLIPQDFKRLMEGQDSLIADWLWGKGESGVETLANMLEIRDAFKNIKELGELSYEGWKKLFDMMSQNEGLQFFGKPLATLNKGFKAVLDAGNGNTDSAVQNAKDFGTGYLDYITTPARYVVGKASDAGKSLLDNFFPPAEPVAGQSLSGVLRNNVAGEFSNEFSNLSRFAGAGFGSSGWFGSRDTLSEASNLLTANQINKGFDVPNFSTSLNPLGDWAAQNKMAGNGVASQFTDNVLDRFAPQQSDSTPTLPIISDPYKPQLLPPSPLLPPTTQSREDQMNAVTNSAINNNTTSNIFNLEVRFDATMGSNGQIDFQQGANDLAQWFRNEIGTAAANFPNNQ